MACSFTGRLLIDALIRVDPRQRHEREYADDDPRWQDVQTLIARGIGLDDVRDFSPGNRHCALCFALHRECPSSVVRAFAAKGVVVAHRAESYVCDTTPVCVVARRN